MKFYKETKIGIIITLIIIATIWGLNFLKGRNLFTTTKQYYAIYNNIGGLQKSSTVTSNGFMIGTVSDVKFLGGNANKIVVEISIERQFKIPRNSVVEIYSSDFMGTKEANLILGNSPTFARNGDTLTSKFEGDLNTLVSKKLMPIKDKAERMIVSIDSVMTGIHQTLTPETQHHIRQSMAALEDLMVTEKDKITSILNNLESVSNNLEKNNQSINSIVNNVSSLSDSLSKADLKRVIDQTKVTLTQTNEILAKINTGKGSLGKLINDDSMYTSLHKALNDLDSLITDLNNNPKRYVHFSLFGSKDSKESKNKNVKPSI